MLVEKYGWANQKILLVETNLLDFYQTCENSKMFNIASRYLSLNDLQAESRI